MKKFLPSVPKAHTKNPNYEDLLIIVRASFIRLRL